jgi:hypothetical protein
MPRNKVWTAAINFSGILLAAQSKSSKAELIRRIRKDDLLWSSPDVFFYRAPRWKNKRFHKGLAFHCFNLFESKYATK